MEPNITSDVIFLTPTKKIWDMLNKTYGHEKNISHVFEIYEKFFSIQQGDRFVQEFYTLLCSLMDKLDTHQPIVTDARILKEYHDGLAVPKFLSGLRPDVASQICDYVLGVDTVPSLSSIFARALRVSTSVSNSLPDQFAMVVSSRDRGRGRGRGRYSGGGCGTRKYDHYGQANHTSDKYWDKFDKPEWAQHAITESSPGDQSLSNMVTIS